MSKQLEKKVKFPAPGKYVVAVSGGVDSVSLLDILARSKKYSLVVAHLDHGMRVDSAKDCELVAKLAKKLKLQFVSKKAKLGPKTSEATARQARYTFLHIVMKKYKAVGIITAHHADDLLETAIFNAVRGTYRLGLTPFSDDAVIKRPFINVTKADVIKYAKANKLHWGEDSTNKDLQISRNYIRHRLLPQLEKLQPGSKKKLYKLLQKIAADNKLVTTAAAQTMEQVVSFAKQHAKVERQKLLLLNSKQARELIYALVIRFLPAIELSRINILVMEHFAKTAMPTKKLQLGPQLQITSHRDTVVFAVLR